MAIPFLLMSTGSSWKSMLSELAHLASIIHILFPGLDFATCK